MLRPGYVAQSVACLFSVMKPWTYSSVLVMVVYAWTPVLAVGGRRIGSSKPALTTLLVRVPIVVIKHHDPKQRGEEGQETWRQELKKRP